MTIAAESEEIPWYPLDVDMTAFAELVKILNALGNEDALAIFLYTNNGISSSKEAIQTLGLTQKRFYSRLKDLIDNKLVEKVEGEYRHTALGRILCDLGLSLEELLINKEKLEIINQLNRANISEEEKQGLMELFSLDLSGGTDKIRVITSFEDLVNITVETIDNAEKRLELATQYIDNRVIDSGFRALERGIVGRVLLSQVDQITKTMKIMFSLLTNPGQISSFFNFLKSPDIQIRKIRLPYTFLIVDKKICIIEIKDQISDIYKFAIYINDEIIANKLMEVYDSFWENSEDLKDKIKM